MIRKALPVLTAAIAVYTVMELTDAYSALLKVLFIPLFERWPLLRHNYVKLRHATDVLLTEVKESYIQISQTLDVDSRK